MPEKLPWKLEPDGPWAIELGPGDLPDGPDAPPPAPRGAPTVLEERVRFSRSLLWRLQQRFYAQQGPRAWGQAIVPQLITCNAYIAQAYARVVAGYLRDLCRGGSGRGEAGLDLRQPCYLVELGAGSGRFAYLLLRKLLPLLATPELREVRLRYVMADCVEQNLAAWQAHPALQPWVEQGLLDFAFHDAEGCGPLTLRRSGERLAPGELRNPLIVLANYFFDSLPLDPLAIADGVPYHNLVTIRSPQPEPDRDDPAMLPRLELSFTPSTSPAEPCGDPELDGLLADEARRLGQGQLHFPSVALRCCRWLQELSGGRLLLLTADHGYIQRTALQDLGPPQLVHHGSFSLEVNYHALAELFRRLGGEVLHTAERQGILLVAAFLLGHPPGGHREARQAFQETIDHLGPEDFFLLKYAIEPQAEALTIEQLLAYLRLSCLDPESLRRCLPALLHKAEAASPASQAALRGVVRDAGALYFPCGEAHDLPLQLGLLLQRIGAPADALGWFVRSRELYGPRPETMLNLTACLLQLGQAEQALRAADELIAAQPADELARQLRAQALERLASTRAQTGHE